MHDHARLARTAAELSLLLPEADLASSVRSLARGRGVDLVGVEGGVMLVRELLAALEIPPRGPAEHRPLAAMALDLVSLPRRRLDPPATTWGDLFVGEAGAPPLYPPAAGGRVGPERLRARWAALRADLGLPADDAALAARAALVFHPVAEGETLALPARTERLLLRDHGPRHARHAELDVEEVRATLDDLDLDLVRAALEPERAVRDWLRPGVHHATGVSLTIEATLRSVYLSIRAEAPEELVALLSSRFHTESYEELLADAAAASRDDEGFARALLRLALGAPHAPEPRALALFDEAFHSPDPGARGAAVLGAGVTRWLPLHDPVVRQKGDDDPAVRALAERIAPSLDPTL